MPTIRFICSLALPAGILLGSILPGSFSGASAQGSAAREALHATAVSATVRSAKTPTTVSIFPFAAPSGRH
jgi:hypothetical protein